MKKTDLIFTYQWTAFATDAPNVSGYPDGTFFNPNEGSEMLFLIKSLMNSMSLLDKMEGQRIEFLLKKHLPRTILSQCKAKAWVESNWDNSFSCCEPLAYNNYSA